MASGSEKLVFTSSGGALDGVTVHGELDLTVSQTRVDVINGLTLNGTLTLGEYAYVGFKGGSQALGGAGTVVFNNRYCNE